MNLGDSLSTSKVSGMITLSGKASAKKPQINHKSRTTPVKKILKTMPTSQPNVIARKSNLTQLLAGSIGKVTAKPTVDAGLRPLKTT
jgi:hypothetical protein